MASGDAPREEPSVLQEQALGAIVRLAAPTTGVMLVGAASNVLYTYFVSRLGAQAIAALSLVFPVSLLLITVMGGGISPGVSSAVSRSLGAGRPEEAGAVAEHSLLLTAVLAIILTVFLEAATPVLFSLLGGAGEVLRQAVLFARILFAGLLLMFLSATLDSVLRGEGNVRVPALCGSLALGVQTILAPVFMFVLGWGLTGAPAATLAGQVAGAVPRCVYVFGRRGAVTPGLVPRSLRREHFAEILRVGVPSSLTALVNHAGMIVLTGIVARFGTAHLAAFGLGTRLGFVLFTAGYGVAVAALTLVGMATGAGRRDLVLQYARRAVLVVSLAVVAPLAALIWRPQLWFGMFTNETAILSVGGDYVRIIGPSYVFAVSGMVLASCFQALRQADRPLRVAAVRVVLVLALALGATRGFDAGVRTVFLIIAGGSVVSTTVLAWMFTRTARWRTASDPCREAAGS